MNMSVESFEEIYCVEQINIPVTFPHILKAFAKAAIRTQPYDLLRWTSAYFRALANGAVPPVKERFEYPPFDHPTGLTPRYLKTLLNQLDHTNIGSSITTTTTTTTTITTTKNNVALKTLLDSWQGIVLSETVLYQILMIGHLLNDDKHYELDLYRFLAVACGLISNNLLETMIRVCELFTDEPDGGSAMIPLRMFLNIYGYLARLDCSSKQLIPTETSSSQNVEIASESLEFIEPSPSSLSDNEKKFLSNCSISIVDSKSVCTHETSKTFDELISNGSSEYWTTMVSDDKTIDDNIKCENSSSVNDITEEEHEPLVDDETSIKFIVMKEVTGAHDESCDNTDEDFDDTVVMLDEHVTVNKNHESLGDLEGSFSMTSASSIGTKVTDEIPRLKFLSDDIKSDLMMSASKSSTSDQVCAVGGDIGIGEKSKAGDAEKFPAMVNEVVEIKERKNHMVVDTIEKQKQKQKQQQHYQHQEHPGLKTIFQGICECHEESRRVKKMREDKTGPVQLPLGDEKPPGMIPPGNKVAEFIRKMKETTHPCVNYDVVGIGGVVSDERITKVGLWLTECARQQGGHVGPRNLRHFLCPSLYNNNNNDDNDDYDVNNSRGAETN